jgi:hypothetical protein
MYIEKNNTFFSTGHVLEAGSLVSQKKGTARVCCYGGQFAVMHLKNGARFIAKDCWWEGSERVPLELKGAGDITIDGAKIAPVNDDSLPTIKISSFNGNISLLNLYVQGSLAADPGSSALNLLVWNVIFYHKMNPGEYVKPGPNSKIGLLGLNAQCFDKTEKCKSVISIPDKEYKVPDQSSFLETMTAFDRSSSPIPFTNLPAGVSNIYISRVSVFPMPQAIVFTN